MSTSSAISTANSTQPSADDKGWQAGLKAEFIAAPTPVTAPVTAPARATRLGQSRHYGPLRVQRPFYPEGADTLHLYLLHPPGGLVGGDCLTLEFNANANAHSLITTPSAGKVYRNICDLPQRHKVLVEVDDCAIIEYLPQENIVYNGADAELSTQINISGSGIFIGWEITCLGRRYAHHQSDSDQAQNSELFHQGRLKQNLILARDGKPVFIDRCDLNLKAESNHPAGLNLLQARNGFNQQAVFATFVISTGRQQVITEQQFDLAQWQAETNKKLHQGSSDRHVIAITQKPQVLIARMLGDDAETIRHTFEALWEKLRLLIINKNACTPRIWLT